MAYATVDELRAHLDFPDANHSQDADLSTILDVATQQVADYTGRTFGSVSGSAARIFDGCTGRVLIDDAATVTVVAQSSDRQTWSTVTATEWWTEPANTTPLTVVCGLATFDRWVRVTGTWGYAATVPDPVAQATLMVAARLWKRRSSPTGVEGFGDFGIIRPTRTDSDVAAMLAPYRRADRVMGLA